MRRFWMTLCCFGLLTSVVCAEDKDSKPDDKPKPTKAAAELKTLKDKASYAIGLNIGRRLAEDGYNLDADVFAKGLSDALSGKKPRLNEQELATAIQTFVQKMRAATEEKQKAQVEKNKKAGEAFLAANAKKKGITSLKSGLQYEVLKSGNGKSPKATDKVKTHYHGTLLDGTVFDSSVDRGEPIVFPVGGVIKGWTEALQLMKVGDKWRLFVPSNLAYGERGAGGKIGPNTTLVFEVELLGIE